MKVNKLVQNLKQFLNLYYAIKMKLHVPSNYKSQNIFKLQMKVILHKTIHKISIDKK